MEKIFFQLLGLRQSQRKQFTQHSETCQVIVRPEKQEGPGLNGNATLLAQSTARQIENVLSTGSALTCTECTRPDIQVTASVPLKHVTECPF